MKIKIPEPPMVVVMDVLVMFLFIFMLQATPSVDIELPENTYFNGMRVAYQDKVSNETMLMKEGKWSFMEESDKKGKYIFIPCEKSFSQNIITPHDEQCLVMISGELFNDISGHYFLACMKDQSACTQTKFPIGKNGKLNRDELINNNEIFRELYE